jgi:predicted amidohydrolase
MNLKIGVAQITICNSITQNVEKISDWIESAARKGIKLLCFPECSLTGYIRDFKQISRDEVSKALVFVHDVALRNKVNVIVGTPSFETDKVFNSALVLLTDGKRLIYHKNNLTSFDEKYFTPGKGTLVFEIDGVKCGVLICRDQNYPFLAQEYGKVRVKVIFILAAHYYGSNESWLKSDKNKALPIARAVENNAFVFKANAVGSQGETVSLGGSLIVSPEGFVLAEADKRSETILDCEIATSS